MTTTCGPGTNLRCLPAVGKVMMLLRCMMNAHKKALWWVRWIFPYGKTPSAGCTTMPAAYRRTAGRRGPARTMYAPTAWCAANGWNLPALSCFGATASGTVWSITVICMRPWSRRARGGKVQSRSDGTAILLWGQGCNWLIGNRQGNLSVLPCRTSAWNRGKHSSTWMVRWGWMSKKSDRL